MSRVKGVREERVRKKRSEGKKGVKEKRSERKKEEGKR